jgi:hypothetical protein
MNRQRLNVASSLIGYLSGTQGFESNESAWYLRDISANPWVQNSMLRNGNLIGIPRQARYLPYTTGRPYNPYC